MTAREALQTFYDDTKAYNNDMRKYPAYYFDKPKNEALLQKWSKQQDEMFKVLTEALDELDKLKTEQK